MKQKARGACARERALGAKCEGGVIQAPQVLTGFVQRVITTRISQSLEAALHRRRKRRQLSDSSDRPPVPLLIWCDMKLRPSLSPSN